MTYSLKKKNRYVKALSEAGADSVQLQLESFAGAPEFLALASAFNDAGVTHSIRLVA